MVRTILGPVPPEALGWTLAHEHVLTRPPAWRLDEDPDFLLDSPERSLEEIERFRRAGGGALVDATARDWGRDAQSGPGVAKRTSVHLDLNGAHTARCWLATEGSFDGR